MRAFFRTCISVALLALCSQAALGQGDAIRQWVAESALDGVVLVADQHQVLFHEAFGLADREAGIAHRPGTRYPIMSITKWLTAVLVLQLHEDGLLDLDAPVGDYLPRFRSESLRPITLHHLLTHTSGLQNAESLGQDVGGVSRVYVEELDLDKAIAEHYSGPVVHEVGSHWEYNTGDYVVLGKVIETVTGKLYAEVLSERILDPLEMRDSGVITGAEELEGLARGYHRSDEQEPLEPNPPARIQNYFAGGAIFSNAPDLLTFTRAFFSGRLVSEASIDLLLRTYPETESYGYGVWVRYPEYNRTVPKVMQRFGKLWGINTLVSHFIEDGITVIVLSNTDVFPGAVQHLVGESLLP